MSDEQPKKIQVTPQNALILLVGLTNMLIEQNKVIIQQLGAISMKLDKPVTDIGGPDGIRDNK